MTAKAEFEGIYKDVAQNISSAKAELGALSIENKEGREHVANVVNQLQVIEKQFSEQLSLLKDNAEWDVFTVAFFGETSAGKSTIIESLRILFDEEHRQEFLGKEAQDLEKLASELQRCAGQVLSGFVDVYAKQKSRTIYLQNEIKKIAEIALAESEERMRLEAAKTSFSVKRNMLLALLLGGIVGAGLSYLMIALLGG